MIVITWFVILCDPPLYSTLNDMVQYHPSNKLCLSLYTKKVTFDRYLCSPYFQQYLILVVLCVECIVCILKLDISHYVIKFI